MKFSILGLMLLLLSGCASYNSSFECKANRGVGCKSVSRVNNMIDRGEVPYDPEISANKKIKKEKIKARHKLPFPQIVPTNTAMVEILRKPESVLKIWLAPYVDEHGAYQEAQYVHEVVDPGSWLEEHV